MCKAEEELSERRLCLADVGIVVVNGGKVCCVDCFCILTIMLVSEVTCCWSSVWEACIDLNICIIVVMVDRSSVFVASVMSDICGLAAAR